MEEGWGGREELGIYESRRPPNLSLGQAGAEAEEEDGRKQIQSQTETGSTVRYCNHSIWEAEAGG